MSLRVEPLPDAERAAWELVAAAQEAAQQRDMTAVHARLAQPACWPADVAGFERLLGRLERPAPSPGAVVATPPA